MPQQPSATTFDGTVYYRQRSVLVLAPTFVAGRGDRTHRRPSIRCLLGCSGPFEVETADGSIVQSRALLLAPAAGCTRIEARNADFALFDFALASAEYLALQPRVTAAPWQVLALEPFADLLPTLRAGQQGNLACPDLDRLMTTVVETLTGIPLQPLHLDERVMQVMRLLDAMPLADSKLPRLAAAVNLSPERLRHLFKEATGSTLSQYARTAAVWRALGMLAEEERSVTDASHAAGFHDVSHFYRVYADMFGISLSEKNNIRKYRRVRCFA